MTGGAQYWVGGSLRRSDGAGYVPADFYVTPTMFGYRPGEGATGPDPQWIPLALVKTLDEIEPSRDGVQGVEFVTTEGRSLIARVPPTFVAKVVDALIASAGTRLERREIDDSASVAEPRRDVNDLRSTAAGLPAWPPPPKATSARRNWMRVAAAAVLLAVGWAVLADDDPPPARPYAYGAPEVAGLSSGQQAIGQWLNDHPTFQTDVEEASELMSTGASLAAAGSINGLQRACADMAAWAGTASARYPSTPFRRWEAMLEDMAATAAACEASNWTAASVYMESVTAHFEDMTAQVTGG
jgi:hypothetical protein